MKNIVYHFTSLISSILVFLFGDFDFMLKSLITLMIIDYFTGITKAIKGKKVNSSVGGIGIIKKAIYLSVVTVSVILDGILQSNGELRALIIYSFIFNEIISIFENCSAIGIKIPSILASSLDRAKNNKIK